MSLSKKELRLLREKNDENILRLCQWLNLEIQ